MGSRRDNSSPPTSRHERGRLLEQELEERSDVITTSNGTRLRLSPAQMMARAAREQFDKNRLIFEKTRPLNGVGAVKEERDVIVVPTKLARKRYVSAAQKAAETDFDVNSL